MRLRIVLAGTVTIAAGLLLLSTATRPSVAPSATRVTAPSPTSAVRVPSPEVQAFADRVTPGFDGILRMDQKLVIRLGDVPPGDRAGVAGATDATWAVAVVGDIVQTSGRAPIPNSQCAVWFLNPLGQVFAFQTGAISTCDVYVSNR